MDSDEEASYTEIKNTEERKNLGGILCSIEYRA